MRCYRLIEVAAESSWAHSDGDRRNAIGRGERKSKKKEEKKEGYREKKQINSVKYPFCHC